MKIILDSTFLIDLERQNEEAVALVERLTANNEELMISTVTAAEILTGAYFLGSSDNLSYAKTLLAQFFLVPLDEGIADKTAQYLAFLLKNGNKIDFKDIAIAATFAVTKSDFLITQNKRHFEVLPEIGSKAKTISEFKKIYR